MTFRCAWICDDAYITFRTVDNFHHGFGLRWNVAERVQAYTHPLWMLLLLAAQTVTRSPYISAMALSLALSWTAVGLLLTRLSSDRTKSAMAVVLLSISRAFVDYSSSGLENPLSHLILTLVLLRCFTARPGPRHLFQLALLVCFGMLTRLDHALLYAPPFLLWIYRSRSWRAAAACACAFLPLLLWEIFAIAYYGFPFPNTAYAKLGSGLPSSVLMRQGLQYFIWTLIYDPLTWAIIAGGLFSARFYPPDQRPTAAALGLGGLLYLVYVLRIGGDFMGGRFLTAPLLIAVCLLARNPALRPSMTAAVLGAGVITGFCSYQPTVLSGGATTGQTVEISGVVDERLFYYHGTGLLHYLEEGESAIRKFHFARAGLELRTSGRRVLTDKYAIPLGMLGYYAGPGIHIIDPIALSDPLLSRLPAMPGNWRIGHFPRALPEGYIETIESGSNQIRKPSLAEYHRRLSLITRGPIWSAARWREIWRFNTGQYCHLLMESSSRPSVTSPIFPCAK